MAISDLFKSRQERERDLARRRRRAFREADNAIDSVRDRGRKIQGDRDRKWVEARRYLGDGQKAAAQRCLQSVRAGELMMQKLEMKRWVFEQLLTKMELAKTDQEFTQALGAINTVVQIDPEAVADVLGTVEDKLGEQVDTDKIWQKMHDREMDGVATDCVDAVPSLDQMMTDLEDEVAAELGKDLAPAGQRAPDGTLKEQITEGNRRLKDLMEGDK